jgi:hypothetical protein
MPAYLLAVKQQQPQLHLHSVTWHLLGRLTWHLLVLGVGMLGDADPSEVVDLSVSQ